MLSRFDMHMIMITVHTSHSHKEQVIRSQCRDTRNEQKK